MQAIHTRRKPACAVIIIFLLLLAGAANPAAADNPQLTEPLFLQRFESFKSSGYDPLTVPVEWFHPTEQVTGAGPVPTAAAAANLGEQAVSASALKAAAAYAAEQNSTALLVYRQGRLQYEHYWQGQGRESFFNPQSMSKTVLGMMVGVAIRDGYVRSVSDPVSEYLPEWASDPRGRITIEQLLQMSGGLAQISSSYEVSLDNPAVYQHFGTDFVGPILALPQIDLPGSKWEYNNNETNLLGLILERASGRRYADYLSDSIWKPAGLADARLYLDRPGGEPMFSCCILSRPMDWLQLGVLFLQDGNYRDQQIVPADWIRQMQVPAETSTAYGYQVWLGNEYLTLESTGASPAGEHFASEPFADPATVIFSGFGYQRVWVMPEKKLVIVRAGKAWPPNWDNAVIPNTIYRGSS